MKRTFVVALLLGACADYDPSHDGAGNLYPPECPASIVDQYRSLITYAPLPWPRDGLRSGGYYAATKRDGRIVARVIVINSHLAGWMRADVEWHEACHAKMDELTGSPDWPGHCHHAHGCAARPHATLSNPLRSFGGEW